jgi:hypothetical protein
MERFVGKVIRRSLIWALGVLGFADAGGSAFAFRNNSEGVCPRDPADIPRLGGAV